MFAYSNQGFSAFSSCLIIIVKAFSMIIIYPHDLDTVITQDIMSKIESLLVPPKSGRSFVGSSE